MIVSGSPSGTRDARLDALLDSLAHVPSNADRLDLWRQYRDRKTEFAAVTVLVYPRVVMAVSDRLGDVAVDLRGEIAGVAASASGKVTSHGE